MVQAEGTHEEQSFKLFEGSGARDGDSELSAACRVSGYTAGLASMGFNVEIFESLSLKFGSEDIIQAGTLLLSRAPASRVGTGEPSIQLPSLVIFTFSTSESLNETTCKASSSSEKKVWNTCFIIR